MQPPAKTLFARHPGPKRSGSRSSGTALDRRSGPDAVAVSHLGYRLAYGAAWVVLRPALGLLGGVRILGRENVPRCGPVLLAANHTSFADPPLMGLACPRPLWFMARANLFRLPLLAPVMRLFHAFPVRVNGVDREAIRFSEQLLHRHQALCIFPEGGVSDDGRLQPLKSGLALLALRTGVPIVPVGIARAHRFLPPNRTLPGFAPGGVEIRIGPAIDLGTFLPDVDRPGRLDELNRRIFQAIAGLLPDDQQPTIPPE
jgi:1-acyl-sn-glycerol-3-phosphate acyltransferase